MSPTEHVSLFWDLHRPFPHLVPLHPFPDPASITGLVLAGGRASRMGGVDKGLQRLDGRPMVAHVIARIAPQVGRLLISANRNAEVYRLFGHRVVADLTDDYAGPLAGLEAGLSACETACLVTVPCDAPFVPLDLVARLAAAMDPSVDVAVAATRTRMHPVFAMMRATVLPALVGYLAGGGRAVGPWIEGLPHRAVSFDDEQAFRNVNTVEELREAGGGASP